MLTNIRNTMKIIVNILGGSDNLLASIYYNIIGTREGTRALFTPHPPV